MEHTSTIPERLKTIRERANLTVRDLASRAGMSTSGYGHYESPTRFKGDFLPMKIATRLAQVFANDEDAVAELMAMAGRDTEAYSADLPAQQPEFRLLVPVYDIAASAGPGRIVELESPVANLAFSPRYLGEMTHARGRDLAVIRVSGDSMEPTLLDGDVVLLDRTQTGLDRDGMHVLRFGEELVITRIGRGSTRQRVTVISDNRLYPSVEMDRNEVEVVGRVLWYGRKV
jgi:phage repressor protein C with HTH and peptisase S24 domain